MRHYKEDADDIKSKRQQILTAAYTVFSRKGYYRATIDEIIALADTGKGTVYNYFTNKEKLFYTLISERSRAFKETLNQIMVSKQPFMEKTKAMIMAFLRFYIDNADLWRVLMHEIRGFGGKGSGNLTELQREKYRDEFRSTIEMLVSLLQEGIEQGVVKECDVTKAAHGLFSVIMTMVFQKFADQDNVEEIAATIADIFFYGVAVQPKHN